MTAGPAVDDFIEQLIPLLSPGDIIIDGGNSEYLDTSRRCQYVKEKGLLFVGSGVSFYKTLFIMYFKLMKKWKISKDSNVSKM